MMMMISDVSCSVVLCGVMCGCHVCVWVSCVCVGVMCGCHVWVWVYLVPVYDGVCAEVEAGDGGLQM